MGPERSSPSSASSSKALHNFTMPCGLRWGNQRFLRCMKVNSNGQISTVERRPSSVTTTTTSSSSAAVAAASGSHLLRGGGGDGGGGGGRSNHDKRELGLAFRMPPEKRLRVSDGVGIGIAAVREKVILDLQTAADKMKDAIFKRERFEDNSDEPPSSSPDLNRDSTAPAAEEGVRPWSLRTRRASFRLVSGGSTVGGSVGAAGTAVGSGAGVGGVKNLNVDVIRPNVHPLMASPLRVAGETAPRLRSGAAMAATASPSTEKKERAKFSVPLTRREIEEDFMAMVGHRPLRRPKKRPKYIQKQLDTLFPGLWLTEITADIYKVPETQ